MEKFKVGRNRTSLRAVRFPKRLEEAVAPYHSNASISAVEMINELIALAKDLQAAGRRGEKIKDCRMKRSPSMTRWRKIGARSMFWATRRCASSPMSYLSSSEKTPPLIGISWRAPAPECACW